MGRSWASFPCPDSVWGHLRAVLGLSWAVLGSLGALSGPSSGRLGACCSSSGALGLGPSGAVLGLLGPPRTQPEPAGIRLGRIVCLCIWELIVLYSFMHICFCGRRVHIELWARQARFAEHGPWRWRPMLLQLTAAWQRWHKQTSQCSTASFLCSPWFASYWTLASPAIWLSTCRLAFLHSWAAQGRQCYFGGGRWKPRAPHRNSDDQHLVHASGARRQG